MFFEKNCFTKYPSPYWCFHVIGGEFTGITLLQGFKISGIKDVTPTIKNQQGYDICDRFSSTNQRQFKLYYTIIHHKILHRLMLSWIHVLLLQHTHLRLEYFEH